MMENDDYANDTFNSIIQTLEVQVFYSLYVEFDIEEFEIDLMKRLEKIIGWRFVLTPYH